jgi:hypothetical protein
VHRYATEVHSILPRTVIARNYRKEKSLYVDLLPYCIVFYLTSEALCQEENSDLKKRGKTWNICALIKVK